MGGLDRFERRAYRGAFAATGTSGAALL